MRPVIAGLFIALALAQAPAPSQAAPEPPASTPAATPAVAPPAGAPPEAAPPVVAPPEAAPEVQEPVEPPLDPRMSAVPPRMVWVFIDKWKEFGGWVVRETAVEVTVDDETEERTFNKAQVLEVVELTPPTPGQHGRIQLRDGSIVKGEILRDDLVGVGFRVDSLRGRLSRNQVYRVFLDPDFQQRYDAMKANTTPEQHYRRFAMCRWLIEQNRLDLAEKELEDLVRDSDSDDARDLLRSVRAQRKFAATVAAEKEGKKKGAPGKSSDGTAGSNPGSGNPDDPPAPPGPPSAREILPKDLLTDDDVNLIRVYEIDLNDPPRVRVPPEGVRQLLLRYGSSSMLPSTTQERNALYGKDGMELARILFDLKARDLYRYIEVQEDPPSLAKFRTRVHNSWMLPNCATSRCHGGVQAGKFFLYTGNAKDARIRYTNLMTLLNFKVDDKPVVNFETPADSLLVQYAMPRHQARFPHPDVKGWKPVFTQGTPQLLEDTVEWIRSMYKPRPEYPVNYKAPKLDAPDAPAKTIDGPDR